MNPPAVIFLSDSLRGVWDFSPYTGTHRYVLAPEGSRVLDPEMAQAFDDWLHAEPEPWVTLTEATFDFRGGAA